MSTINERTKSSSSTTKIRARRAETMPREVYCRRGRELGGRGRPERRGALPAKLILGRVRRATGRTGCGKRGGALPTELHAWGILVLAPGTLHTASSQRTGAGAGQTGGASLVCGTGEGQGTVQGSERFKELRENLVVHEARKGEPSFSPRTRIILANHHGRAERGWGQLHQSALADICWGDRPADGVGQREHRAHAHAGLFLAPRLIPDLVAHEQ